MDAFHSDQLIALLPRLRKFALALTRNADMADDLVQDVVVKSLKCWHQYTPGTNFVAWLNCIMRTTFIGKIRRKNYIVSDLDAIDSAFLAMSPNQEDHVMLLQAGAALNRLDPNQKTALILVGARGMNYKEAAEMMGCPVGTIKSRISRGRLQMTAALAQNPV